MEERDEGRKKDEEKRKGSGRMKQRKEGEVGRGAAITQ